jgi:D-tyrosyl-tRNA(Tyr) deacylase
MRAVVQRVSRAEVRRRETGEVLGRIERGLCVLVGVGHGDGQADVDWLADKVAGLRIFSDGDEVAAAARKDLNRALGDFGGGLLVISQFTLYGDASRGRRPSFTAALAPAAAEPLYESFVSRLRQAGHPVATGRFGAMMDVELVNDGPVTMLLDSVAAPFRAAARASAAEVAP